MRAARTITAMVATAALVMAPAAAGAAPAPGESAGEASTHMLGADATVTGLGDDVTARLLDIVTDASTVGTPSAASSVVPLGLGGQTAGEASASSDGQSSAESDGGQLGDLGGVLGVSAAPFTTSATTTADSAVAQVDAVTAQLSGLAEVLGMELTTSGISSAVSPEGANATQGLTVTGLDLSLADLGLGADVLGQLGLGQILDLLASLDLDGTLPEGLPGQVDTVEALQQDLADALSGVDALETSITDTLAQLSTLNTQAADLQAQIAELEALVDQLESLDLTGLLANDDLLATLDDLGCDLDVSLTNTDLVQDAIDCVNGEIADLQASLPAASTVNGLLDSLVTDLETLDTLLATVTTLVDELLTALGGLEALLDQILSLLPDLLGDAAGTELVGVGAFDVGMNAIAKDALEESSATVLCAPTEVTVLGQSIATPDCSDGLSEVGELNGTITNALGSVTDVLNTLPLAGDLVQVGDLRLSLFGNLVESVEEVDGVVTATAGFDVLDLQVPTVTLDPSAVTGPLGDLGGLPTGDLDQLIALVDSLQDDLGLDALGLLDGVDLGPVTTALDELDGSGQLSGLVDQVLALLDGLDVGDLGSLTEAISTPGLSLVIDPVSTASFEATPAAAPDPDPETPAAPAPTDDPDLPSTGGGLALAAMMALGGAAMLARRRQV